VALDLIAQAEHDPQARTYFLTPDHDLLERVTAAFEQELPNAGRSQIVEQSSKHTKLILVRDLDHAIDAVNDLAAEHVLLAVPDPRALLPRIRNAGAVFLGRWTAVPFGDHVLPTAGTARFSSGLRAADYVTVSSVIQMSPEAARRYTPGTSAIARAEGLVGHAKAMDARAEEAGPA
jgi:histidinol dehydrogenase